MEERRNIVGTAPPIMAQVLDPDVRLDQVRLHQVSGSSQPCQRVQNLYPPWPKPETK
jgi:hypothetical protein